MDQLFIALGLILCIIGLLGSFVPIIPGPITSWFGLLVINLTSSTELNYSFLLISLMIALFVFTLDIIIPIIGLKKFGGTKKRNDWSHYRLTVRTVYSWSAWNNNRYLSRSHFRGNDRRLKIK